MYDLPTNGLKLCEPISNFWNKSDHYLWKVVRFPPIVINYPTKVDHFPSKVVRFASKVVHFPSKVVRFSHKVVYFLSKVVDLLFENILKINHWTHSTFIHLYLQQWYKIYSPGKLSYSKIAFRHYGHRKRYENFMFQQYAGKCILWTTALAIHFSAISCSICWHFMSQRV